MNILVESKGHITKLRLSGVIDAPGSDALKRVLNQILVEDSPKELHLDFDKVSFIGTDGVVRLLAFNRKFTIQGGIIRISNLKGDVREVFRTLRLDNLFYIIKN